MTTATIEAATRAAFARRYRNRPWHRFDAQHISVQCRWTLVCTKVVQGVITGPRAFRDEYHKGFAGVKAWTEIGRDERDSWQAVFDAAMRAADQAAATERMAA